MKNTFYKFCLLICFIGFQFNASGQLIITAVYDGPLSGGTPKGVELFATADIPDLSIFGLGSANNGGGTDGQEFTFPNDSASEGDFIYVSTEIPGFSNYFGFAPDTTSGSMSINGDDAIELFKNGSAIDVFGVLNVDGNGEPWEYLDGWAYRVSGTAADGTFNLADWTFSGPNALDGCSTNASCVDAVMPIGTYAAPLPIDLINFSLRPTDSQVELNWSTGTEEDNDYFQLERAGADRNFEPIAKIEGAVNSLEIQFYSYTDESPLDGMNYYRLLQVDLDGTKHYHNTLVYQQRANADLIVYPNPAKDNVVVSTKDMIGGVLELRDLSGRVLQSMDVSGSLSDLAISDLKSGMYIISVEHNGLRYNNRFVKN